MKYDTISFGSAVLDVFVRSPDFQVEKSDKVFTEKSLVIPYGVKAEVEELTFCSGGGGTNTAVGFSRLGLRAAVVARCGWDLAGGMVREEIKKEGVSDEFLLQMEGERTDYSTILIGPDGDRTILVYRGGTRLEESMIKWEKLEASWFMVSSLEGNLDLLAKLTTQAKKKGTKVAFNPGRKEIEQTERLLEIAKEVDILIVNREEAARILGLEIDDQEIFAKACLAWPGVMVVVTDGVRGSSVCLPGKGRLVMDGLKLEMVEATGAGDGFACGLVAGLVKGWELEKALKLGTCNGASTVTKLGAKAGLIREAEIDSWLSKKINYHWEK